MSFIELRQTGDNDWKGKYDGNYGIYTVKVTLKGNKAVKFSCTCPSDNYPCKHIGYILEEIAEETGFNNKKKKNGKLRVEDLIKTVPEEKLREFITAQAKYNDDLFNAILLEFGANANVKGNKYSQIIQNALESVQADTDDYYHSDGPQSIDILDQWFDKARDCLRLKQYQEAIQICKACIEEYSRWMYDSGEDDYITYFDDYQFAPFEIIEEAAKHLTDTEKSKLFKYCLSEIKKEKYKSPDFEDCFHKLLENLAVTVDPDAYIALQDELLAKLNDNSSYEAKTILLRKIGFYRRLHKPEQAWVLIEQNIQIESFRLDVVKNKIEKREYQEAKVLINDFLAEQEGKNINYYDNTWCGLLLEIAQKEKDIPAIRQHSYGFINKHFELKYYKIYKSTFKSADWKEEREKLLLQYDEKNYFSDSVAGLLKAEGESNRLLQYIEKYLSVHAIENYYKDIASSYPEKTLELFRKALVFYAERNLGRSHYEFILVLLKKMSGIRGGNEAASDLIREFRIKYKNRRAMMEIMGKFRNRKD